MSKDKLLFRIKFLTAFYIFALFFWGVTAFPIETEIKILCSILGISLEVSSSTYTGLMGWVATVANGVVDTNANFPFMAYGTDWLAFSHLVIAVAFIGLYRKPVTNSWIISFGMIACVGVIPLALICGPIRGIPFFWTLIDCSFCLFGLIPLLFLRKYVKELALLINYKPAEY